MSQNRKLLMVGGASLVLALSTGIYSYILIGRSSAECVSGAGMDCRVFVPWLWLALGFLAIAVSASVLRILPATNSSRTIHWVPIGLLVGMLILALCVTLTQTKQGIAPPGMSTQAIRFPSTAKSLTARAQAVSGATDVIASGSGTGPHPFPEIPRSRSGLPFENDPFIAKSKEEQAWLDRNGYPNEKQWAAYTRASDLQLREASMLGDKAARGVLLHRELMSGNDAAIDEMLKEGAAGSGFALDMLASFLASNRGGDKVSAFAISRVSEMRGNFRLAGARDLMFDRSLTNLERLQGEQEAMEIYRSIHELQKKLRGADSSPVDPRPVGG